MSWSVTVVDPNGITVHNPFAKFHEEWARENPAYPVDADMALELARRLMLKGATLAGGRTPVIAPDGGPDEVVVVTITGSANSKDFLALMHKLTTQGPDEDTAVGQHYKALEYLRKYPCKHEFHQSRCLICGVYFEGGLFHFVEPDGRLES